MPVQLFRLLMLALKRLSELSLLVILFLEVAQLGLVFLLDGVFRASCLLKLFHRNVLHINGVLQLEDLFLEEELGAARIVKLLPKQDDLLL